jgi:hypothetical protein
MTGTVLALPTTTLECVDEVVAYVEARPAPFVTPGPDLALAREVLAYIEAHPEEWHQSSWLVRGLECGTGGCYAGLAALMRGWAPEYPHVSDTYTDYVRNARNGTTFVQDAARLELRLTYAQARRMFAAGNTLADLRQVVAELHGAPVEPLSWER